MIIGVLKEPSPETRISLTPETVSALKKKGYSVLVENNAGENAFCSNEQYIQSGADIADRSKVLQTSDILLSINAPADLPEIPSGKILIGTFSPLNHPETYRKMGAGRPDCVQPGHAAKDYTRPDHGCFVEPGQYRRL